MGYDSCYYENHIVKKQLKIQMVDVLKYFQTSWFKKET